MGHNISVPMKGPFSGISVGISPVHKIPAAREAALSTPTLRFGRLLAFVKFAILSRGTPIDGNCLYHAVNQALYGKTSAQAAADLRARVVDWALMDTNLPQVAEFANAFDTDTTKLVTTLVRSGNWAGPEGNLAPRMVASALGLVIVIHQPSEPDVVLCPLFGAGPTQVDLDLDDSRYSVRKQRDTLA